MKFGFAFYFSHQGTAFWGIQTGFSASLSLSFFSFVSLHVAGMAKAEPKAIKLRRNCIRSLVPWKSSQLRWDGHIG